MIAAILSGRVGFSAFQVVHEDGRVHGRVVTVSLDSLSAGDVVIRAAYSSVNYKDALAVTGAGKIMRRMPLIAGIDVAGTVESSTDARFTPGDRVLVTGYDLGVAHDGGFAERCRVPGDWVVPVPDGLSLLDAMAYGTAGFTAALAVLRLERNGLAPGQGPVAVTGATGGVGSVATAILARLGYQVVAITGKDDQHDYLRGLGAGEVRSRHAIDLGTKPLEKATWAGAVDAVGGELLAWLLRTANVGGGVASTGLTGGIDLKLTVMPFILRGVSLLGVDSVACPMDLRRDVWRRLAGDMRPASLVGLTTVIPLEGIQAACETLMAGGARGRFVVQLEGG
jgi:NADPH2:quinone reductase